MRSFFFSGKISDFDRKEDFMRISRKITGLRKRRAPEIAKQRKTGERTGVPHGCTAAEAAEAVRTSARLAVRQAHSCALVPHGRVLVAHNPAPMHGGSASVHGRPWPYRLRVCVIPRFFFVFLFSFPSLLGRLFFRLLRVDFQAKIRVSIASIKLH